jgi:hypothetical protein
VTYNLLLIATPAIAIFGPPAPATINRQIDARRIRSEWPR